jgi:exodeoxyribonuclease V alpha subunit
LDLENPGINQNKIISPDLLLKHNAFGHPVDQVPFVIEQDNIYIRRDWLQELFVSESLKEIASEKFKIPSQEISEDIMNRFFSELPDSPDWQKVASALSLKNRLLVISGGPGTGKTTTVAQIILLLLYVYGTSYRIALTAPTGKAAARMSQALRGNIAGNLVPDELKPGWPVEAKTLHRLLTGFDNRGILPDPKIRKLPYDLIVVDEASMIDLKLMGRLLKNLRAGTRLILLGDKDQLSSVEAGSVLADICDKQVNRFSAGTADFLKQFGFNNIQESVDETGFSDSIVYLTKSYRFESDSGIAVLAESVNRMNAEESEKLIADPQLKEISFQPFNYEPDDLKTLFSTIAGKIQRLSNLSHDELIRYWSDDTWLTVIRRGPFGSVSLNKMVEDYLVKQRFIIPESGWYHGRPILVTRNDYSLGVYNGDLGVCVKMSGGNYQVLFTDSDGNIKRVYPHRIQQFEPAFLITVHKSQGSEFNNVSLLLPDKDTQLLTRELIYTAITRARNSFRVAGRMDLLKKGIERKTERFTGLKSRIYHS